MTLFRDAGHTVGAAMAEHNLGCADLKRGDLVSALAHMDAARPVLLPLSPVGVAITNQDRAEALMAAGLTRSGLAVLDESARTFGNHRLPQRRAEAELTIARASLGSDPPVTAAATTKVPASIRSGDHVVLGAAEPRATPSISIVSGRSARLRRPSSGGRRSGRRPRAPGRPAG